MRSAVEDLPADCSAGALVAPRADRRPRRRSTTSTLVVVRLLGGARSWEQGLADLRAACRAAGVPLVAAGGELEPDAELLRGARRCRPASPARPTATSPPAARRTSPTWCGSSSDTVLLTGFGFDAAGDDPGRHDVGRRRPRRARRACGAPDRPLVAIVFYRAHLVAGNTASIRDLAAALDAAGADVLAIATYSLRADAAGRVEALELCRDHGVDVIITSTLAAGTTNADGDGWSVPGLDELGIPVIQSPSTLASRQAWLGDDAGLGPLDVASGVAVPEFDGRIIGPTFAFKEVVDDDAGAGGELIAARADPERTARLAGLAVRTARLRHLANADKRVAVVLSAYPTKRARLGNAVGLDTPASAIELLHAMRDDGYRVDRIPADGDALMDELAVGFTYDQPVLTAGAGGRRRRRRGTSTPTAPGSTPLPADARDGVEAVWGPAPGEVYVADGALEFTGIDLGGVLVTIQPPRGFGVRSDRHVPRPRPARRRTTTWPRYRWLTMARGRRRVGRRRHRPPRQARHAGVAAGQGAGAVGRLLPRRGDRRRAALLPVRRQRPRRGHAGQAARPRRHHRPPPAAAHPGRHLRRAGQARAAPRRPRPERGDGPGQAAGDPGPGVGGARRRRDPPRPRPRRRPARRASRSTT